ncbi:MAG: M56 family metallopeptidase [Oscillospiraceae bacterium]|nr:M56 family metallopeptidase [Oscillospiraceae bacterium]
MFEIIITSSVLILILVFMRRILRFRITPTVQYALWLLVAARLLIPGTLFTSPISILGAADNLQSAILTTQSKEVSSENTLFTETIFPEDTVLSPNVENQLPLHTISPSSPINSLEPTQAKSPLYTIWIVGMCITGGSFLISNLLFYRTLRRTRHRIPPEALPRLCTTPVYHTDQLYSPCLFGLSPAIYVNTTALSEQHFEHILAHEQTHLRHGDHIWSLIRCICLTIHWYHPLVWWAAVLSQRDCELSCDSAVIRQLGENRHIRYGETLIAMLSPHRSNIFYMATSINSNKRTMMDRLNFIVHRPKMLNITFFSVLLATFCCVILTFGGCANEPSANPENPSPPASQNGAVADSPSTKPSNTLLPENDNRYTHPSGLFSMTLPNLDGITTSESVSGIHLFSSENQIDDNWILSVVPQPADWNENPHKTIHLTSFDFNGTPQVYTIEYNESLLESDSSVFQTISESFSLLADSSHICSLVENSYQDDITRSIPYLLYLNWESFQELYGEEAVTSLLSALCSFADSGNATWEHYHDLLSITDSGLNSTNARKLGTLWQTLLDKNEAQFLSVFNSIYISDTERSRISCYVTFPSKPAPSSSEPANSTTSTPTFSDGEMMNSIARGYIPSILGIGSPQNLAVTLTGDWSLDGIRNALYAAVAEYLKGTSAEDDLNQISIAYSFHFPEEMHEGISFEVPYHIHYKDPEAVILPSGEIFQPGARTEELRATVSLVGKGVTALPDEEFAAKHKIYDLLAKYAVIKQGFTVSAEAESFDVLEHIQSALEQNLTDAGLNDRCRIGSMSVGRYYNPVWCDPGYEQNISYTVSFQYQDDQISQSYSYSSTVTVTTT